MDEDDAAREKHDNQCYEEEVEHGDALDRSGCSLVRTDQVCRMGYQGTDKNAPGDIKNV
jgi:hypothetical protein